MRAAVSIVFICSHPDMICHMQDVRRQTFANRPKTCPATSTGSVRLHWVYGENGMKEVRDPRERRKGRRWVHMLAVSLWNWKMESTRRGQRNKGMRLGGE